ncbi:PREDICTED: uncharacterized protein LOC109233774 [Nicotiana attenuata]|uniref:uncharacterized protein LOC109233774 n=1 Tax=Nicotiana attenuata TaxID=49451 RepID=UPI0009051FBD|nr:PREDICTED: uncharacterized protein LOC109233774 [Nicotiana attenuata]
MEETRTTRGIGRIKRVLVDPGSSANIIRSGVIEQQGLLSQINTIPRILHGFNMIGEETKGEITLQINTSGTTQSTKFQVIDGNMRYNALLGRPWIHDMRTVPSNLHQVVRFPTRNGITTIYGEQRAAKEMFAVHHEASTPTHSASNEEKSMQTGGDDEEDFFDPRTFVAPEESLRPNQRSKNWSRPF